MVHVLSNDDDVDGWVEQKNFAQTNRSFAFWCMLKSYGNIIKTAASEAIFEMA